MTKTLHRQCDFFFFGVATMATLPGTVPRMMRPTPGQNYPRTGFPLEGKFLKIYSSFLINKYVRRLASKRIDPVLKVSSKT